MIASGSGQGASEKLMLEVYRESKFIGRFTCYFISLDDFILS